ncbi:hypothetical protein IAI58_16915 (plasmid) [Roseomonas marmotae]|nr:hypothetical protein IAI58_16915 [Roseomonas marmotae]
MPRMEELPLRSILWDTPRPEDRWELVPADEAARGRTATAPDIPELVPRGRPTHFLIRKMEVGDEFYERLCDSEDWRQDQRRIWSAISYHTKTLPGPKSKFVCRREAAASPRLRLHQDQVA